MRLRRACEKKISACDAFKKNRARRPFEKKNRSLRRHFLKHTPDFLKKIRRLRRHFEKKNRRLQRRFEKKIGARDAILKKTDANDAVF